MGYATSTTSTRWTVLLANEQEDWHQTVRRLLEPQGVTTVSARSGREALELIETTTVHVAVLDQRMPGLGGLQVIKLINERFPQQDAPVTSPGAAAVTRYAPASILLADQPTHSLLQEALGMRVFSVLAKPVDYALLLQTLARVNQKYHDSRWVT